MASFFPSFCSLFIWEAHHTRFSGSGMMAWLISSGELLKGMNVTPHEGKKVVSMERILDEPFMSQTIESGFFSRESLISLNMKARSFAAGIPVMTWQMNSWYA